MPPFARYSHFSSVIENFNEWDNTPLFRKKSPVIKIYFPGNDTPTTNEGFSPSVVVVCHFQGRKF
jgi:hypothetical protein